MQENKASVVSFKGLTLFLHSVALAIFTLTFFKCREADGILQDRKHKLLDQIKSNLSLRY